MLPLCLLLFKIFRGGFVFFGLFGAFGFAFPPDEDIYFDLRLGARGPYNEAAFVFQLEIKESEPFISVSPTLPTPAR
jgi:hypothetical protein